MGFGILLQEKGYSVWWAILMSVFIYAGSMQYVAVGGLLGEWLPFDSTGIDFAMTALFLTIFVDQWRESKNHMAAILGVGISVVSLLIFGADKFVIPAIVVMVLALSLLRKKLEKEVLPYAIPEIIAGVLVVGLHRWKQNTLLSIAVGTVVYMVLVQTVF